MFRTNLCSEYLTDLNQRLVLKVANRQIFYATDCGLLSLSGMARMQYALQSGDFRWNLGSLDMITLS